MASGTVAVRLPDEVLEQLQKRATAQNKKVSDLVRELIINGLQQGDSKPIGATPALIEHMDRLEAIGEKPTKAALKAQFLANMSAGFSVDVARLMATNRQPTTEEKE